MSDRPDLQLRVGACDVRILGTIAGYVPEVDRVRAAFTEHRPDRIALGVGPEDIEALGKLAASPEARSQLAVPDPTTEHFLSLLNRFGPTRIPSPDLEAAHELAKAAGLDLVPLDLDDAAHAEAYTKRVKVRHIVRNNRTSRRLLEAQFAHASGPYQLAMEWDLHQNKVKPMRELEELRESFMSVKLRELSSKSERLLAIVPATRARAIADKLLQ